LDGQVEVLKEKAMWELVVGLYPSILNPKKNKNWEKIVEFKDPIKKKWGLMGGFNWSIFNRIQGLISSMWLFIF
jgi:hypothetical protein